MGAGNQGQRRARRLKAESGHDWTAAIAAVQPEFARVIADLGLAAKKQLRAGRELARPVTRP